MTAQPDLTLLLLQSLDLVNQATWCGKSWAAHRFLSDDPIIVARLMFDAWLALQDDDDFSHAAARRQFCAAFLVGVTEHAAAEGHDGR